MWIIFPMETLYTIPHLILAFTDREEMDKENMTAIRKSGLSFRGKGMWPKLEEVVPGYIPAFPEKEALEDLQVLLDQTASVLSWARENPDLLFQNKEIRAMKYLLELLTKSRVHCDGKHLMRAPIRKMD